MRYSDLKYAFIRVHISSAASGKIFFTATSVMRFVYSVVEERERKSGVFRGMRARVRAPAGVLRFNPLAAARIRLGKITLDTRKSRGTTTATAKVYFGAIDPTPGSPGWGTRIWPG